MANWSRILSRGDVEDRRSMAPVAVGGVGLTGIALLFLFNVLTGGTTSDFFNELQSIPIEQQNVSINKQEFEGQDSYEVFTSTVLGSNNDMWKQVFSHTDRTYTEPKLV